MIAYIVHDHQFISRDLSKYDEEHGEDRSFARDLNLATLVTFDALYRPLVFVGRASDDDPAGRSGPAYP